MALNVQIPQAQQVSPDANILLTGYAYDFVQAYQGQVEPWAEMYGRVRTGPEITTKVPMPVSAAGFKRLFADFEYRRLAAMFLELTSDFWQDGVKEEARLIEAPEFFGWDDEPLNVAMAARQAPNDLVATVLQAGKTKASWEDPTGAVKWFATGHPNNPFDASKGTYDNLFTAKPLSAASIDFAFQKFRGIKCPDGKRPRGLRLTHLFVHADDERKAIRLTSNDRILVDSNNNAGTKVADVERYNDIKELGLKVVVCDELTESGVWYPGCIKPGKGVPWVIKRRVPGKPLPSAGQQSAPMGTEAFEWIINDKSSEMYKNGINGTAPGFVSIAARIDLGAALAHPWTLFRMEPT